MITTATLEAISYPKHRLKVNNNWVSYSPFLNLENYQVGQQYQFVLTRDAEIKDWIVSEIKEVVSEQSTKSAR